MEDSGTGYPKMTSVPLVLWSSLCVFCSAPLWQLPPGKWQAGVGAKIAWGFGKLTRAGGESQ